MGTWNWRVWFVTGLTKRLHLGQIACMLPMELKWLWNEQVPLGVKCKFRTIQDHKKTINLHFLICIYLYIPGHQIQADILMTMYNGDILEFESLLNKHPEFVNRYILFCEYTEYNVLTNPSKTFQRNIFVFEKANYDIVIYERQLSTFFSRIM